MSLGAAGIAAISATVAVAAPFAAADTTANGLTVSGSNYAVGTTYTITVVTGSPGVTAAVFDTTGSNTVGLGTATPSGTSTSAAIYWTPSAAGTHRISVTLSSGGQAVGPVDVTVTAASTSTGSAESLIPLISGAFGGASAYSRVS
ncbi:hypothetical protein GL305_07785 [Nocardia seriolae]|uniref:hypothetical protein n=1 Tax=Nocardia seriolae TaxID=37332 RepID=UPI0004B0543B|nr:hypothetical protein [Nocardia seriolae]MTJ66162.1 hypothetical protein [Nocardia seriolae]MTJ73279.1 hypothetical protein [Nocardia seriolae]MTJ85923.1 hypothetical protein [Nocardia seriolae]MTK29917.1 hypothetical protein [Nocardia seriolae]MTK44156.1 hypothetical protein [Nocardia seriolae]